MCSYRTIANINVESAAGKVGHIAASLTIVPELLAHYEPFYTNAFEEAPNTHRRIHACQPDGCQVLQVQCLACKA